ncbi:MAG: UDP-N-acetylmuramoyl-tripeptide--D-alanyl-D-alanine ligase [Bacteriovoracia bacterium]
MNPLTHAWIHAALGLPSSGGSPTPFPRVTTDSRKVQAGDLFVAIPGDVYDGHQFVESALQAGAGYALVSHDFTASPYVESSLIRVPQKIGGTIEGYRRIADRWREQFLGPVVAVTGSVGKTTTKELLAAILAGKYSRLVKTEGSQNGFVGIPMTLLELRPDTQAAVIEVGIDEIGAMQKHLDLVKPTACVLSAIGPEHLEKLRDLPTVASEELLSLTYVARKGGTIAVNRDDEWIASWEAPPGAPGKEWDFRLRGDGALGPKSVVGGYDLSTGQLTVTAPAGNGRFPCPLPGEHNARNLLGAITLALGLGLTFEEITRGLAGFKSPYGRTEIHDRAPKQRFLCDYYNANPSSVSAALKLLDEQARLGGFSRKLACLGDMLELGADEEKFHRALAEEIRRTGVNQVFLFGPRMKWLADEIQGAVPTEHFERQEDLADRLGQTLTEGDIVLIKGSRGMRMEKVFKQVCP